MDESRKQLEKDSANNPDYRAPLNQHIQKKRLRVKKLSMALPTRSVTKELKLPETVRRAPPI